MLHVPPINLPLLAPKQEPHKKAHLLTKNIEDFSRKKSGEWASRQKKKDKTERVTGLGKKKTKKTRDEIGKWNQMTAMRFQTKGGVGRDNRYPRSPFGGCGKNIVQKYMCEKPVLSVSMLL